MLLHAIAVLLPVLFVLGVGVVAGRRHQFDADQVAGLNALVLQYALPALMFVAAASTSRSQVRAEAPFALALVAAFAGTFVVAACVSVWVLRHSLGEAALQANLISLPAVGFFGLPIFGGLFGSASVAVVALGALLALVTVVPLTVILLEVDQQRRTKGATQATSSVVRSALVRTLAKPYVVAPLAGLLLALADITVPDVIDQMLQLIGSTTAGVSIFVAGLIIAAHPITLTRETAGNTVAKMVGQPLVMAALVTVLDIPNPLAREGILLCAIPSAVMSTMLAPHYSVYEAESASTLLFTTLTMLVSMPIAIVLTGAG